MLEKLPKAVGEALKGMGPGLERTIYHGSDVAAAPEVIEVRSSAFAEGGAIPARFTEDGDGLSPPLAWSGVPANAEAVVLVVEDADSPTPAPLVHALVWSLPGENGELAEGALPSDASRDAADERMGRNSYLSAEYLPPDPPPGHGPHRYAFQVFALSEPPKLDGHPGRSALLDAIRGRVLAKGLLIGTYERS